MNCVIKKQDYLSNNEQVWWTSSRRMFFFFIRKTIHCRRNVWL